MYIQIYLTRFDLLFLAGGRQRDENVRGEPRGCALLLQPRLGDDAPIPGNGHGGRADGRSSLAALAGPCARVHGARRPGTGIFLRRPASPYMGTLLRRNRASL